jgi:hypothetical protein
MSKKTQEEISKLIQGTFNTVLGKRCLEHLEEVFVDRNIYEPGMSLDTVAFRQGEASIIKKIIKELSNVR